MSLKLKNKYILQLGSKSNFDNVVAQICTPYDWGWSCIQKSPITVARLVTLYAAKLRAAWFKLQGDSGCTYHKCFSCLT